MNTRRSLIRGIVAACAMLLMILDTKTAIAAAREGIGLCTRTIIPSLFPFFVFSGIINSLLLGRNFRFLKPLGRLCEIPKGAESLLILGFLAGYPIGAQLITQAYLNGSISKTTAKRMLGFCNNAGPAFIFGMLTPLFARAKTVWILWGIHILSALITGWALPAEAQRIQRIPTAKGISFTESLQRSIKAIAGVCGWVILFRIVIGFCNRWFLWLFPAETQVLISGLLELANGCVLLNNLPSEGARFLLAGIMLSFGGLCVGMQTMSVTEGLGSGWYFPGKAFQTALTALLCFLLQPVLFTGIDVYFLPLPVMAGLVMILFLSIFALRRKKVVAFSN